LKIEWWCEPGNKPGIVWLIADAGTGMEYGLAFNSRMYIGMRVPTFLIKSMVKRIERAIYNDH